MANLYSGAPQQQQKPSPDSLVGYILMYLTFSHQNITINCMALL